MNLKLHQKRALVLGGSTGLGRAIAQALIAEGTSVVITARNQERLEKTAEEIKASGFFQQDLLAPHAGREIVQKAISQLGGLDILVTNAGGPPTGGFANITAEQWQIGFQGLWMSAVEAIQEALPGMKTQKWGRILLLTSIAAKEPLAGLTISNGLRAGLLGLANSLSREVASFGVTVNALLPGYTDTERLRELKTTAAEIAEHVPMKRLGRPEELAALTTFLASDLAGYITGQAIACDGGYLMGV